MSRAKGVDRDVQTGLAMRVVAAIAVIVAAACVGPKAGPCRDGVCPAGLDCVADTARGSASCGAGFLDGDACLVCVPPSCGNGRLDPGEACDDGNRTSGDGCPADCSAACGDGLVDSNEKCDPAAAGSGQCSADCRSTLSCGDGFINTDLGEQCDDGNVADGDGCSATCATEAPTWLSLVATPPARSAAAVAYDARRGVVVMFGGQGSNGALGDTWEWDGAAWRQRMPSGAQPSASAAAAMVYDAALERVVLFEGANGDGTVPMWEWDGARWTEQVAPSGPAPSDVGVGLAYDGARGEVVLFGGGAFCMPCFGDTWTWAGSAWTKQTPALSPSPRLAPAMAFDQARGVVVLFGGNGQLADTWEWDGTSWRSAASDGPPLSAASLAYDAARARTVLFDAAGETWEWNGSAWAHELSQSQPPGTRVPTLAYDERHRDILLFSGATTVSDTWTWDGTDWSRAAPQLPTASPPARSEATAAFDATLQATVLFGGDGAAGPLGDTWRWADNQWAQLAGAAPPPRLAAVMVGAGSDGVYLFGGADTESALADTWQERAGRWEALAPAEAPPARWLGAGAFDSARGRFVLFGGCAAALSFCGPPDLLGDTWEWDGATWQPSRRRIRRRRAWARP